MTVLIQQAIINDPGSSWHNQQADLLIENGLIRDIQPKINGHFDKTLSQADLYVSPGWVDIFASFADPGMEQKETLSTGAAAAAAGGFTDVFVIPNNRPVTDSKSQVEYIRHRAQPLPVQLHPIGAISRNAEGHELAEMYDMQHSGAMAFSDGILPVQSSGLMMKALQYVKAFDGILIQIPDDKTVMPHGLMHEGLQSTRLGMPGKPLLAEELMVARDLELLRYTRSRIHITGVTSPKSLEAIRAAKKEGLSVTCSVTPYHLFFSDEQLQDYDTNLKVYPPLRTPAHIATLRTAVKDGTIDCIATHHLPHEPDSKVTEFEYAAFGMIGLETCYSALRTAMPDVTEAEWVDLLCRRPRKIFGLPQPVIEKGEQAVMTLYNRTARVTVDDAFFRSRSRNSAFLGHTLTGCATGIINRQSVYFK